MDAVKRKKEKWWRNLPGGSREGDAESQQGGKK